MKKHSLKFFLAAGLIGVVALVCIQLIRQARDSDPADGRRTGQERVIPVEVAPVKTGRLERTRVFSGTLEASAEMRIAPKIAGRIARILRDVADPVERGAEIAIMDDAEFVQAVTSAQADLTVAQAQATEATHRLALAQRELERMQTLTARGVASDADLDTAQSEFTMHESAAAVAAANLEARKAALATAEIRRNYTRVSADWTEGDHQRVVAERFRDEGDTVAANTPILSIVSLKPIRTIFFVSERDYALLEVGQPVSLRTDAFPTETFPGTITRIAPVFRQDSRQARIEASSPNDDERLKPGMFVRATVVLETAEDTRMVPLAALVQRAGETGVFLVNENTQTAVWTPVVTGIRSTTHVAISQPGDLDGNVVTLGQQFLGDGSPVSIVTTGRTLP